MAILSTMLEDDRRRAGGSVGQGRVFIFRPYRTVIVRFYEGVGAVQDSNGGQRLVAEFAGIFSQETVMECLRDTTNRWVNAPVQVFVGLLAERFTRERLHAAAHAS